MRSALVLALLVAGATVVWAEPVVREARVTSESRDGKTWTAMSGRVEATTDLPLDLVVSVVTDWNSYPRLFPQMRQAGVVLDGDAVLLSETVVISVLGFEVVKRFTLRMKSAFGTEPGTWSLRWTQEKTDGSIDRLEGGWALSPVLVNGKPGTKIVYDAKQAVVQSIPGQEGIVGLFYPGELKQIVTAVLTEARKRKEKL